MSDRAIAMKVSEPMLMEIGSDELIIDNFAGGGGASTGIEMALGRPVDIAINHDPEAIAMHTANHPRTQHLCESVWKVDIGKVVAGRKVGLAWFSPDCKHFSKAKGGKPMEKRIRGLAWVALKWAGITRSRVIFLENVEEFRDWGPVVNGQPDPLRKGTTFKRWVSQLRNLGYQVDWRELRACDYGAPTIRKRLFIIARCDGRPIEWPEPTHAPAGDLLLQAYHTAAECIDWSIPCPSIFLTKAEGQSIGVHRPLADATLRRIARGVKRYVIDAARPFIVSLTHAGGDRGESVDEPFRTVTGAHRGEKALVTPFIVPISNYDGSERTHRADEPLRTITASPKGGGFALVAPFISSYYGDKRPTDVRGAFLQEPIPTQTTENRHALISAFLAQHMDPRLEEPLHTITSKPRFGLVTVEGVDYYIADIGMRMLAPRELFLAQGFPVNYVIDRGLLNGKSVALTKTAQVRMCGNSVSPHPAAAIVRAQFCAEKVEAVA